MELKPGYKQTEVGVIPEDWDVTQLGKCLVVPPSYGINAPAVPYSDQLPVYIRITDISSDGRFMPDRRASVRSCLAKDYYLRDGDIVLARTGASVGKSYLYDPSDGPLVFAGFLIRVRTDKDKLLPSFAAAYISTEAYWRWVRLMSMRSGQPGINGREYSQLPIPLPGISEQSAIAAILNDLNALISDLKLLIEKKKNLKKAAMQELLTGKRRLPDFEGEWEVRELGSLGTWRGGMTPSMQNPGYWNQGDFPWISSGDVKISRLSDTSQHVTAHAVSSGAAVVIPAKSIVLVTRSGILRKQLPVALLERAMAINQDIKALIPARDIDSSYLLHALKWAGSQILKSCMKTGTTVESVEFAWLKRFTIPVPSHEEQIAIAKAFLDMEDELAEIEAQRTKASALKQGMMQQLLTGNIRLK